MQKDDTLAAMARLATTPGAVLPAMSAPKLSFVVLSYNYERFLPVVLRSIQAQTIQDFEIVVVDDGSSDNSVAVLRAWDDDRLRLFVHEKNRGACEALALALREARGEWIVNLDADDWVAPEKSERQLALAASTGAPIIGTWVRFVDMEGQPHPQAAAMEAMVNRRHRFDLVESWTGRNDLNRSSTMVHRSVYDRIGVPDLAMVRAPDYEHWTRAVAAGLGFAMVEAPLTFSRQHTGGVTHGDLTGTLLEMVHAKARNLVPLAEARGLHEDVAAMVQWVCRLLEDPRCTLTPRQGHRLCGMIVLAPGIRDFSDFRAAILGDAPAPALERAGRFAALAMADMPPPGYVAKLERDIEAYIGAREYFRQQAAAWEAKALVSHQQAPAQTRQFGARLWRKLRG